jgi:dUTP pyrophosphatase
MIPIDIKRIDKTLHLPEYATPGSVGFDLVARVQTTIHPHCLGRIPGNVIVHVPPGYALLVTLRSSTPARKHLSMPHGVGVIDQDYCGEDDEVMVQVLNFGDEPVIVERGERIAQGVIVLVAQAAWHEVNAMGESRGGFGSTDKVQYEEVGEF